MAASNLTIIGMTLDLLGVLLLFKYGLPASVNRNGESFLQLEQDDAREAAKGAFYDTMSWIGVALVVVGYGFQVYVQL